MNRKQIKQKILYNKERIDQIFDSGIFVLQTEAVELMDEIEELQKQCKHEFKNGKCVYCDLEEN